MLASKASRPHTQLEVEAAGLDSLEAPSPPEAVFEGSDLELVSAVESLVFDSEPAESPDFAPEPEPEPEPLDSPLLESDPPDSPPGRPALVRESVL